MSFYMRKTTLYNEYEHVGQLDWLEFVAFVSCFSFNTQKNSLLNSLAMAVVEFGFIEIYFKCSACQVRQKKLTRGLGDLFVHA